MVTSPAPLAAPSPLFYVQEGSGAPLVLLHGLGCDHRTWDGVRPELSRARTVITPDLPGHGRSPKPWGRYDLEFYLKHLIRWLTVLSVGPVDLVGHSWGGALAVALASRRPDLVRSVGGVSAVRMVDHLPPAPALRSFGAFGRAQLFGRPSEAATRRFLEQGLKMPPDLITPEMVKLWQETAVASTRPAFCTSWQMRRSLLFDRLPKIRCPVWILWGERDPFYPGPQRMKKVVARLREATLETMDAGHLPMFEAPGGFQAKLEAHLQRVGG